ncbi:MAG: pilus assembly protein TadG-related protein [bacterium]
MKRDSLSNETLRKWIQRFVLHHLLRRTRGQAFALFALALPVIFGGGAIAVDIGHLFVAKNAMQNAADAGARAGAAVLAGGGTQAAAATTAANFANQNMTFPSYFTGATPNVAFPAANTVQVTINHNLPLFLAPVIGISTAAVTTNAQAQFAPATTVPPTFMAPLAIYCNTPNGCQGWLAPGDTLTTRRYCGNFFMDGPDGNACGGSIKNNEIFSVGITFTDASSVSNDEFRRHVRDGYDQEVSIGDLAQALPGQRNGWRDAMDTRMLNGDTELVLPVIKKATNPAGDYNVEIAALIKVRVSVFTLVDDKADTMTFTIIQGSVPALGYSSSYQGLNVGSLSTVQLIQ